MQPLEHLARTVYFNDPADSFPLKGSGLREAAQMKRMQKAAAVMQFKAATMVVLVAGTSMAITSLDGYLLAPIMLGRAARANSVAVFVAVMFGGWMWGVLGMLLAVPILMIVKTIADHVESLSSLSELLAER